MKNLLLITLIALLTGCGSADYVTATETTLNIPIAIPTPNGPSELVSVSVGVFSRYEYLPSGQYRLFTDKIYIDSTVDFQPVVMPNEGQLITLEYFANTTGSSTTGYGNIRFGSDPQWAIPCALDDTIAYDRLL